MLSIPTFDGMVPWFLSIFNMPFSTLRGPLCASGVMCMQPSSATYWLSVNRCHCVIVDVSKIIRHNHNIHCRNMSNELLSGLNLVLWSVVL